jgi:membrane protein DedA with SNARE-associated domain
VEILTHLISIFAAYGYIAVFCVLVACGFGIPIPEDIALVAGGVICGLSAGTPYSISVNYMVFIALFGVLLGDGVMFGLGRYLGPRVTRLPGLKHIITPENYAKIQEKAHKHGDKILFVARFLPGLRAPIFIVSGISQRVSLLKFILMDGGAALISVPALVYLGYFFAYDIGDVIKYVRKCEHFIFAGIAIGLVVFVVYRYMKKSINKSGEL